MKKILSKAIVVDKRNKKVREYLEAQERGLKEFHDVISHIPNFESSIRSPQVKAELAAQSRSSHGVIAKIRQFFHQ